MVGVEGERHDARIVHHDVDAPVAFDRKGRERIHLRLACHIGTTRFGHTPRGPYLVDHRVQAARINVGADDPRPLAAVSAQTSRPNPAAAPVTTITLPSMWFVTLASSAAFTPLMAD